MKQDNFDQAAKIKQRMNAINMVKTRVDNEQGHFQINFGVSIKETSPFCPIMGEEDLIKQLTEVTKKYCAEKLIELQEEFDKI